MWPNGQNDKLKVKVQLPMSDMCSRYEQSLVLSSMIIQMVLKKCKWMEIVKIPGLTQQWLVPGREKSYVWVAQDVKLSAYLHDVCAVFSLGLMRLLISDL